MGTVKAIIMFLCSACTVATLPSWAPETDFAATVFPAGAEMGRIESSCLGQMGWRHSQQG